jgi:prevent-host-death family protein
MVSMGVRELKGQLSRQLKRVQSGVSITITDRGKPIAVLSPAEARPSLNWAYKMVARGEAAWSGGKPKGLSPRIPSRGKLMSDEILEDRGDPLPR